MTKIAIYSRKSKFTEEGESIENQINMCKKYAETILCSDDYEIFEDEGFSGGNINRPNYKKMIAEIKSKKFTHLICYRLDRISRNVADFTGTLKILDACKVSFISIKEQFDTSTAMGRAMMNVSATFAQLERETIAERIKDNLRELAKTGRWLGGPTPLGYESIEVKNNDAAGKSRKKHILKINDNEIAIVKLIFKLFLEYKSFQKVALDLESKGISSRKGSVFSRELVKQAINNPVYVVADENIIKHFKNEGCEIYCSDKINESNGIMPYNRRKDNGSFAPISNWLISIGEHKGIISSDTWIKCQNIKEKIKAKASNRECTSQEALLSGLMICAHCGSGMAPRKNVSGKYLYRYYSCNLRNKSAKRCDNDAVNAFDAEDYVINKLKSITVNEIIADYKKIDKSNSLKMNNNNLIGDYKKEIIYNKETISGLIIQTARLTNNSEILDQYTNEIEKLTLKNKELENLINKLDSENLELTDTTITLDQILNALNNFKKLYDYTDNFEDKKRLIQSIIKFITYDSNTGVLDVVLVGSDRERARQKKLPLSNRNRRISSC